MAEAPLVTDDADFDVALGLNPFASYPWMQAGNTIKGNDIRECRLGSLTLRWYGALDMTPPRPSPYQSVVLVAHRNSTTHGRSPLLRLEGPRAEGRPCHLLLFGRDPITELETTLRLPGDYAACLRHAHQLLQHWAPQPTLTWNQVRFDVRWLQTGEPLTPGP